MKFFAPFQLSENISETPEGYLVCKGVALGRTGEMVYGVGETPIPPGPDGKVVVIRSADELFRLETMASFEGKPVTILHPKDFVAPENWSALSKGTVQHVRRGTGAQESDLVADLLITDRIAIELVKNGLREVSCGYEAEYTQTGVGRGVQTNIIGNHLALVDEGRAGSAYAINDHKGKGSKMKLADKIKAIFAKAQDEAMQAACDVNTETPETKEGFVTMKDMKGYFDEKFAAMSKKDEPAKDAGTKQDPSTGKPAEVVAKDEEKPKEEKSEDAPDLATVLAKIEERLAKLEGAKTGDEEEEESEDSEEESEDDDFEESTMSEQTGDSAGDDDEDVAARVEILAPGLKVTKGVKAKALQTAYGTKDGKAVIDQFTGGKALDMKDLAMVNALFLGVSELLKAKRSEDLSGARRRVRDEFLSNVGTPKGAKTPEDINAIHDKHYANRK